MLANQFADGEELACFPLMFQKAQLDSCSLVEPCSLAQLCEVGRPLGMGATGANTWGTAQADWAWLC